VDPAHSRATSEQKSSAFEINYEYFVTLVVVGILVQVRESMIREYPKC